MTLLSQMGDHHGIWVIRSQPALACRTADDDYDYRLPCQGIRAGRHLGLGRGRPSRPETQCIVNPDAQGRTAAVSAKPNKEPSLEDVVRTAAASYRVEQYSSPCVAIRLTDWSRSKPLVVHAWATWRSSDSAGSQHRGVATREGESWLSRK